jgi:hypothetical protein
MAVNLADDQRIRGHGADGYNEILPRPSGAVPAAAG